MIKHDYQGLCPDELQPDSRDPECAACLELDNYTVAYAICDTDGGKSDPKPIAELIYPVSLIHAALKMQCKFEHPEHYPVLKVEIRVRQ